MYVKTEYRKMNEGRQLLSRLESQGLIADVKEDMYDVYTLEFTFSPTAGNDQKVRDLLKKNSDILKH